MNLNSDDPKLTAYALGELDPAERAEVEKLLVKNPEVQQWVEAVRKTAGQLESELRAQSCPALKSEQTKAIEAKLKPSPSAGLQRGDEGPTIWQILSKPVLPGRLVWCLASVAICAMLAALVLPSFSKAKSKAQGVEMMNKLRQFQLENQGALLPEQRVMPPEGFNTESYSHISDNPFLSVAQNPLSTFSIDVDTASYSIVRRFLDHRQLPAKDAVRIEEMINYFPYDYRPPKDGRPFAVHVEIASCPWNEAHRLVRVGLKGREIARDKRPPSNLVFLIDVSGSMQPANKLPLLKKCLRLLTEQLTEDDHVSIVVYAGAAGEVLPSTSGDNQKKILRALDKLQAGGSTHGSQGIQLAYRMAVANFIPGGVNRVILCTDGDFNVGITSAGELMRLIEDKAKSGVFLSVLGFGMGNYKDSTVEMLADKGNGNYAYIDTLDEGRKVLVEQMSGTLVTIAKDVKIQVEFNPAQANAYRLIGYENRLLNKEDFNNDQKDAGDIGAGHTVTALYEVVPAGSAVDTPGVDPLKYQRPSRLSNAADSDELLTLKLRYKEPDDEESKLIVAPVVDRDGSFEHASADFKFAAAVAEFGMILRDSPHKGNATIRSVRSLAGQGLDYDEHGYREEFLKLVDHAQNLLRNR